MVKKIFLSLFLSIGIIFFSKSQDCRTCKKNSSISYPIIEVSKSFSKKEVMDYAKKHALQICYMSNNKKHNFEKEIDFKDNLIYTDLVEYLPKENGRFFKIKGQDKMILIRSEYSLRLEMAKKKLINNRK